MRVFALLLLTGCGRISFDLFGGDDDPVVDGNSDGANADSGGMITLRPGGAIDGDGFVAEPDLCGTQVFNSYGQTTYRAIHVGRDFPCSANATYRAFIRFPLAALGTRIAKTAAFRVYHEETLGATAGVRWLRVPDFGSVTATTWNATIVEDRGVQLLPASTPGWVEIEALASLADAQAAGDTAIAFELRYEDETMDPGGMSRWYGIIADDNGANGPEFVVTY